MGYAVASMLSMPYNITQCLLQSWDDNQQGPVDPFAIAEAEIDSISERLRQSLLTDIPALGKAAEYFFQVCNHWQHHALATCLNIINHSLYASCCLSSSACFHVALYACSKLACTS